MCNDVAFGTQGGAEESRARDFSSLFVPQGIWPLNAAQRKGANSESKSALSPYTQQD